MSTINKTFLRVLLAIACCIALAFSLLPQADAATVSYTHLTLPTIRLV